MDHEVKIITGPPSDRIKKEEATKKLTSHPQFPKNASFSIENVEGRWIAAVAVPTSIEKVSAPPFAEDGPTDEGLGGTPTDTAPEPPSGDGPSDEPKGDKDEKGPEGLEALVHELLDKITTITDALGLGGDGSPVPGAEGEPHAPHEPPHDGPSEDAEGKTHTVHERAMKPGEAPPGSTPIGSPAFASVADDHPWKNIIGQKRTFVVEEEIGDATFASVHAELRELAEGTGYAVKQLREASNAEGKRTAKALLQRVA